MKIMPLVYPSKNNAIKNQNTQKKQNSAMTSFGMNLDLNDKELIQLLNSLGLTAAEKTAIYQKIQLFRLVKKKELQGLIKKSANKLNLGAFVHNKPKNIINNLDKKGAVISRYDVVHSEQGDTLNIIAQIGRHKRKGSQFVNSAASPELSNVNKWTFLIQEAISKGVQKAINKSLVNTPEYKNYSSCVKNPELSWKAIENRYNIKASQK